MDTSKCPPELTREELEKVIGGARPPTQIMPSKDCASCEHTISHGSQDFPK